jgi:hypothetical protein
MKRQNESSYEETIVFVAFSNFSFFVDPFFKGAAKSKKGKKRRVDAVRKRSLKLKRKARLGKQIEQLGLIVREVDKEGEQRAREDLAKAEQRRLRKGETRRVGRNKFEVRALDCQQPRNRQMAESARSLGAFSQPLSLGHFSFLFLFFFSLAAASAPRRAAGVGSAVVAAGDG